MAKTIIDPFDWDTIVGSIRSGRCVPFLGAGVNVTSEGRYDGLLLGSQVASCLVAKFVGKEGAALDELISVVPDPAVKAVLEENYGDLVKLRAYDLARVALHVEMKPAGRGRLLELLTEILPDESREPSPLLATLAQLPVRLVVTTNYDRLMERAFRDHAGVDPLVVVQPTRGFTAKEQRRLELELTPLVPAAPSPRTEGERPILYKIHGTFGDDADTGLVISEEDYIEFLTVAGADSKKGIPRLISQMIVDSTLLFLGYGLEDWNFRTIYKGLVERLPAQTQRMSFAIQNSPSPFWAGYWGRPPKTVTICDVDLYEFADELAAEMGL